MRRSIAFDLSMIATLLFVMVMCFAMANRLDKAQAAQNAAPVALCDTDSDCAAKFGGNGDPSPAGR